MRYVSVVGEWAFKRINKLESHSTALVVEEQGDEDIQLMEARS
jgi:hypothetical protein